MTETTPDYAGLIERLHELAKSCGYEYGTETGITAFDAVTALRTLLERNVALKRERDQLLDKLHCMCGSPIDHSAWEGHTPVSVYDHSLDQERSRAEAAEARLAALTGPEGDMRDYHEGIVAALMSRAEAAEARLAEALKVLGMMLKEHDILSGNFGDVMDPKHKRPDRWPTAAEAARRALEGGGE